MSTMSSFKSCVSRLHDVLTLRRNKKTKSRLVISAPFDFKKEDSACMLPGISGAELYMLREKAAASIAGSAITSFAGSPDAYDGFDAFDTVTLAPSSIHDFHPSRNSSTGNISSSATHRPYLNRSTSSFDRTSIRPGSSHHGSVFGGPMSVSMHRSMTAPQPMGVMQSAPGTPTRRQSCCRRCKSARDISSAGSSLSTHVSPMGQRFGGSSGHVAYYHAIKLASTEPYVPTGLTCPSSSSSASSIS
ncbi:hypothetical protein F503_05806 [Ophiostoma piceae UAMH 11346]|uniref:Uncharacterized protein n=1 Tax=Ophiostoma piceae (strain UAMH 11346) TaxID=1262450 RepID=S3CF57_OPHP1|nr:hypothetical protein F503_05806 [Ophiostoma piceae UAMH 11346]